MSERENAFLRRIEQISHEVFDEIGGDLPPELKAKFVGNTLAAIDALFAIRDGKAWRTIEDPQEIARQLLHDLGIGD